MEVKNSSFYPTKSFLLGFGSQFVSLLFAGPGCSSLGVGAFSENGPFRPSGEVLVKNQYSWNRGKQSANVYITI
jgi:hypothetical protein